MNNTIASSALRPKRWLLKYPKDFFWRPLAHALSDINIAREDIIDTIKTIPYNSSGGAYEFPEILLKQCGKSPAHPLQLLYKNSPKTGEMPIDLKRAIITKIYTRVAPGTFPRTIVL